MPMIPISVDATTIAVTSTLSGAIALAISLAVGAKFQTSLIIAIIIGGSLYYFGIVPIGFLVVIGFVAVSTAIKMMFSTKEKGITYFEEQSKRREVVEQNNYQYQVQVDLAKDIYDYSQGLEEASQMLASFKECKSEVAENYIINKIEELKKKLIQKGMGEDEAFEKSCKAVFNKVRILTCENQS